VFTYAIVNGSTVSHLRRWCFLCFFYRIVLVPLFECQLVRNLELTPAKPNDPVGQSYRIHTRCPIVYCIVADRIVVRFGAANIAVCI
jgi:hypothetical protein